MRTRLTLRRRSGDVDLLVTADATATVGDVATALFTADPANAEAAPQPGLTLQVAGVGDADRVLVPTDQVVDAGLRSGSTVWLTQRSESFAVAGESRGAAVALLRVLAGPDAGREFPLVSGANIVGRGRPCDVRLTDPLVSKRHLRVNVTSAVEIIDLGSANGVVVGGRQIQRESLATGDVVTIGDSDLTVVGLTQAAAEGSPTGDIGVNRSPRVVPRVTAVELTAPEPPKQPHRQRFPWVAVIAPIILGVGLYLVNPSIMSVMFVALGPVLGIGAWLDQSIQARREKRRGAERFAAGLSELETQVQQWQDSERAARLAAYPSLAECLEAGFRAGDVLWTRRPEHEEFRHLRLGLGSAVSAATISMPGTNDTEPEHWRALTDLVARFREIDDVPVDVDLVTAGSLGVAGRPERRDPVARALVAQLALTYSPAELVLTALCSRQRRATWEWLTWLPHVSSPHTPLGGEHLAADAAAASSLVLRLEEVVSQRRGAAASPGAGGAGGTPAAALPVVVVLVEDEAPADRARLTRLAEDGRAVGVHVVWCADAVGRLPAACRTFVAVTGNAGETDAGGASTTGVAATGVVTASVGDVPTGRTVSVQAETLPVAAADRLARLLAPMIDAGAPVSDDSDLPRAVNYLAIAGRDLVSGPEAVLERWHATGTLAYDGTRRHEPTLRALVGLAGADPLTLDLRTQGPHALVGGTTGAGKSEFLQSWVLGMATAYSPRRVTFLFVDYKGGAAFADCVRLPHFVGLVTDLSPHLVRRALTSLRAELRYREHLLNAAKAKDLVSMEREGHPDTPPALIIVVDEFAALVQDVPEFVDGMVDVAQRGRSLGLHLVLATQRPAGVIKDNLRANTNLRVALRMADEDDSTDILGLPLAAHLDPAIPGRGAVKTGPGRITAFQTGYAGGHTSEVAPPARIEVAELGFGSPVAWNVPEVRSAVADERGPTDIARIVAVVGEAGQAAGIAPPRRPWLDVLADAYDLARLRQRTDTELTLGVVDDPSQQRQQAAAWRPDVDGNLGVYGAGGSGKSTLLRTIAVSAMITPRGGPVQVYGLDFGSRGLAMLERMPHVGAVVAGDDGERVARLLRWLHGVVAERAARYAAVSASSIVDYRRIARADEEPRLVLLVDGMAAFREEYDTGRTSALFVMFEQIASDGRAVGVHVVVTADRVSAVPPSIRSTLQRKVVLRLADEGDYGMLDVAGDVLSPTSPPGRGIVDDLEVQVAVLGGSPSTMRQAEAIDALVRAAPARTSSPHPIERMPEEIALATLPAGTGDRLVLGVEEESLAPWGVAPEGTFLVAGPPGSGRTSALLTFAAAARAADPQVRLVHLGPDRSPVRAWGQWAAAASLAQSAEMLSQVESAATRSVGTGQRIVLVVEDLPSVVGSLAEGALEQAVAALVEHGHLVVAEGELSRLTQYGPLLQTFKSARRGMVLQPDSGDLDQVFRTEAPRSTRREFPPGRGFVTERGQVWRLQLGQV